MLKFKNEILVRNKRIDQLENLGFEVFHRKLSDLELVKSLREKLVEEAKEACEESNPEKLIGELADVLEVFETLVDVAGLNMDDIQSVKQSKKDEFGGFEEGLYIETVQTNDDNPEAEYYLERPYKYPKIR